MTNVEPGLTETEFSVVRFKGDVAKANELYKGVTPITGDDIAEAWPWRKWHPQAIPFCGQ